MRGTHKGVLFIIMNVFVHIRNQSCYTDHAPMSTERPARQIVPPDPLTNSQHQTRAARAAERRGRRAVGAAQRHKRGRI